MPTESALQREQLSAIASITEFPRRNEIVERLFNPREEIDQFGFKRRIYHYNDITFSFRGREELPVIPTMDNSNTILLGSIPVHVRKEEFESYRENIEEKNAKTWERRQHFVVTKDIHGIIALVNRLAPHNTLLNRLEEEIKSGIYSQSTLDLVDSLLGCNWVDETNVAWKMETGASGADAEAIVIASLLGDQETIKYIQLQKGKMAKLDKGRQERFRASLEQEWQYHERWSPPKITDLVGVHTTKYPPRKTKDGHEIFTTAEAQNWLCLRNTCHITLNHKVRSHLGGNWDISPFTIIAPFELMLEANGNPSAINELDTWWTRNSGETLKFPEASLVEPGIPPEGQLIIIKDRNTIFKGRDYTLEDVAKVEDEEGWSGCWNDFAAVLIPLNPEETTPQSDWDFRNLSKIFIEKYFPDPEVAEFAYSSGGGPHHEIFGIFFKNGEGKMLVKDRVLQILKDANLEKCFKGNSSKFQDAIRILADRIIANIESRLSREINDRAVEETIKFRGFPTAINLKGQTGALGRQFDAYLSASAHFYSPYSMLTYGHLGSTERAEVEGPGGNKIFDWSKYKSEFTLSEVDGKTRRVVYVSGCSNARM